MHFPEKFDSKIVRILVRTVQCKDCSFLYAKGKYGMLAWFLTVALHKKYKILLREILNPDYNRSIIVIKRNIMC